ncbi:McrB family protein [Zunongwangia atlantica]|uniref:ATP/GTP-binding motif-containing protein n=1 Tax=Zunongwangia atlantica 22II14-10F7 TaxID=1185767 RepID=A0A1Y1T0P4_9FLAO|nr:AAA family ATPase [Zunongwangia atlantica]ORL44063.1 ATP/GTP-binding motif-containing protein [Zunongwangia atlantica 22II14-10F7]
MNFHEEVFRNLNYYSNKNSEFRFLPRQVNRQNKLEKGLWFQGDDALTYAFVGLIDKSGGINKTRSVGLVFKPKDESLECFIEIVFKGEKDQKLVNLYHELAEAIPGFKKVKKEKYYKYLGQTSDGYHEIFQFLDNYYSVLINVFQKANRNDALISEEKFRKLISKINLHREKTINYWIFQSAPKIFNLEKALRGGHVKSWKVAAHKDSIQPGDKVILWETGINAGCYALAEVISDVGKFEDKDFQKQYYLNKEILEVSDRVKIKILNYLADKPVLWKNIKNLQEFQNFNAGNRGTNFKATKEQFQKIKELGLENDKLLDHVKMKNLNTILYGPPGTGKTYKTKELAVNISNPNFKVAGSNKEEERDSLVREYDRLFENGQIVFTTFHQSYSYEDFIEGIKPIPPTSEGDVGYKVMAGIFKKLCDLASEKKSAFNFDEIYSTYVNDVIEQGTIELQTPVHKKPFVVRINSNETSVAIPKTESATEMGITKEMLKDYIINGNIKDWKPYTLSIAKYIEDNYSVEVSQVENEKKNYVIIIDEINRGNVSSIFGELITLLEPDKRSDGDEKLSVELPYSKKNFSVPGNVYLIGTMNTADRSVEALDTALRRRFMFEEVMPKPDLLPELDFSDINLSEVLKTINDRIEVLLDRDHTIGHSYFLKITSLEDLKEVFENKIIPLLQEYFYNDYEKIALILGEGFVKRNEAKVKFAKFDAIDVPEETVSYELKSIEDISEAIKALLNK